MMGRWSWQQSHQLERNLMKDMTDPSMFSVFLDHDIFFLIRYLSVCLNLNNIFNIFVYLLFYSLFILLFIV